MNDAKIQMVNIESVPMNVSYGVSLSGTNSYMNLGKWSIPTCNEGGGREVGGGDNWSHLMSTVQPSHALGPTTDNLVPQLTVPMRYVSLVPRAKTKSSCERYMRQSTFPIE